jgi:hypothetical protein
MLDAARPLGASDLASQLAPDDLQMRPGAQPGRKARTSLTAAEREVILTIADDQEAWHVYTDSARLTGLLLRFCHRYGIPAVKTSEGYEFDLPRHAVRFQMRRGRQQLR